MTAGTWPLLRSLRAAPLPRSVRAVALRLTVAMTHSPERSSFEQRAHGLLGVGVLDRFRQQLADGQYLQPVELFFRWQRDRVGHRHLDDRCGLEPLDRWS